jgi:protein ImuB
MLWLALRFPLLPLEVYARAAQAGDPLVVVSGSGPQAQIVACNEGALACGIRPHMGLSAAAALDSRLKSVMRDSAAEQSALERIAGWAYQFTPAVSIAPSAELLLEIEGSLGLFGGLAHLWREVAEGVKALGYEATLACAPTPRAAQWFARAGLGIRLQHPDALHTAFARLPVGVLEAGPEVLALLEEVGVATIEDVLRLPRAGLARRVGSMLIDELDRALGRLPDPRSFFAPPAVFRAVQPLPAPAGEAEMLVFAARRLLLELCGLLAARASGAQRLAFTFVHHRCEPTRLTLSLFAATRDAEHLTSLLRERLARTLLCPVTAVALESELLLPLAPHTRTLFPDRAPLEESATRLIERLRARLGDEAVTGLRRFPDHRPERAWRSCTPGVREPSAPACAASRPLWLLERPQPLAGNGFGPSYGGRLTLLAGPERIESGWWDGEEVARDYFVASTPSAALVWIYRERSPGGGWFLHGFFS